jgi:hypothetical protein
MTFFSTLLAQFGDGFSPPADTLYTQDVSTDPLTTMEKVVSNMIGVITVVGSMVFLINFLMAALSMISAGGEASKLNTARDKMTHAVIGLVVLVATYAIAGLISSIVGLKILSPKELLEGLVPA